jgi:hypothetical protein
MAEYREDRDTITEGVFLRLYSEMQADEVPDHLTFDPGGARRREEDLQQEAADSLPLLHATFSSLSHNSAANGVAADIMRQTTRVDERGRFHRPERSGSLGSIQSI